MLLYRHVRDSQLHVEAVSSCLVCLCLSLQRLNFVSYGPKVSEIVRRVRRWLVSCMLLAPKVLLVRPAELYSGLLVLTFFNASQQAVSVFEQIIIICRYDLILSNLRPLLHKGSRVFYCSCCIYDTLAWYAHSVDQHCQMVEVLQSRSCTVLHLKAQAPRTPYCHWVVLKLCLVMPYLVRMIILLQCLDFRCAMCVAFFLLQYSELLTQTCPIFPNHCSLFFFLSFLMTLGT